MRKGAITTAGRAAITATEALLRPSRESDGNRLWIQWKAMRSRIARKLGLQAPLRFEGVSLVTDRISTVTAMESDASRTEVDRLSALPATKADEHRSKRATFIVTTARTKLVASADVMAVTPILREAA